MNNVTGVEKDLIQQLGFELVHDGQHNPDRFQSAPEEVGCFIRRYRKGNVEVVFRHDLRQGTGDIVRMEWSSKGRERFRQDTRPHKNGRDFFTLEAT